MTTKAQITANRQNARRSTGPRTESGKARVRHNALTHGLCGLLEAGPSLSRVRADLRKDFHPATPAEEALVGDLACCLMLEDRASRLLNSELDLFSHPDAGLVLTMRRYLNTADRNYYRTLEKLHNLQQQRQLQKIGFVSQKTKDSLPRPQKQKSGRPTKGPSAT